MISFREARNENAPQRGLDGTYGSYQLADRNSNSVLKQLLQRHPHSQIMP